LVLWFTIYFLFLRICFRVNLHHPFPVSYNSLRSRTIPSSLVFSSPIHCFSVRRRVGGL
jgi:hypothetical protein